MSFTSLKSSLTFSTSEKFLKCHCDHNHHRVLLPLRYSILRLPSSECHELLSKWSIVLTSGLYSQPDFRSGIHLQIRFFLLDLLKYTSPFLPPAAGALCWVPEPAVLVTHNCPHKPGIACRTEITKILWTWDQNMFKFLNTCSKCSFLPHLVCKQVCHCSYPPFCIHQVHRLDAF